jgi:hypothetical protein
VKKLTDLKKLKSGVKFECKFWRENSNWRNSGLPGPIFTKFYQSTQLGDLYKVKQSALNYLKRFERYSIKTISVYVGLANGAANGKISTFLKSEFYFLAHFSTDSTRIRYAYVEVSPTSNAPSRKNYKNHPCEKLTF